MQRKRVYVSGRVQGVFFRDSCRKVAGAAGVHGWVRNLPDGRVEAVLEGEPGSVDEVVAWLRQGPRLAHVRDLEVLDEPFEGLTGFHVR